MPGPYLRGRGRRVPHGGDAGDLSQPRHQDTAEGEVRRPGVVVDAEGQVRRPRDGNEVLEDLLLGQRGVGHRCEGRFGNA